MKKRMTNHMARIKHSNVRHNDRDRIESEHIDAERSGQNRYWNRYDGAYSGSTQKEHETFSRTERKAYEELFSEHIADTNERARKSRHLERLTSAEKMLKSVKTMPMETIWQIGSTRDRVVGVSETWRMWQEFMRWHQQAYPKIVVLDYALHSDEQYVHVHSRECFTYTDKNGVLREGQEKSLEQMNVPLPEPDKPRNRFNNRKMTYTRQCTEKLREIARGHGIDISEIPLKQKHNLQKEEAILQELKKEQREIMEKMQCAREFERMYQEALREAEEEVMRGRSKKREKEIER